MEEDPEYHGRILDVMHGGAAGVIFGMLYIKEDEGKLLMQGADMCTTTALGPVARPGYWELVPG